MRPPFVCSAIASRGGPIPKQIFHLGLILAAQTVASGGPLGIPAIASLIRDDLGLTLAQAGSFVSAYTMAGGLLLLALVRVRPRLA